MKVLNHCTPEANKEVIKNNNKKIEGSTPKVHRGKLKELPEAKYRTMWATTEIKQHQITTQSCCCSVTKSCPTLRPCGLQHTASLSFIISQSSLKLMCIESVMPSSHLILCHPLSSRLQSLPASGSIQMSQLFASGGQSTRVSASTSVPPMNIRTDFL